MGFKNTREINGLQEAVSASCFVLKPQSYSVNFDRGKKFFEVVNHLGNVLVTVSDRKLQITSSGQEGEDNGGCEIGSGKDTLNVPLRNCEASYLAKKEVNILPGFTSTIGEDYAAYIDSSLTVCIPYTDTTIPSQGWYYAAEIVGANDYYPFGSLMPGRKFLSGSYRYGFNGKEMDNEVSGSGAQYDYGFRIYDPRLGRFKSLDPLQAKYPELTPYQFSSNNPIFFVDIDGLEGDFFYTHIGNDYVFLEYVDHGKGAPNRVFIQDVNASQGGSKDYRYEYRDMYWEMKMIPGKFYSKEEHEHNPFTDFGGQSQFDIDRRAWLDDGAKYSDLDFIDRWGMDYADNSDADEMWGALGSAFTAVNLHGGGAKPGIKKPTTEEPVAKTNEQVTKATSSKRPTWQQSETDVVTSDYTPQQSFKNGKLVPKMSKGSVRPEGFKPGESIEVKNYDLTTEKGINSMIRNVTKQVRQRQTNLPKNTTQNVMLDVRG